MLNSTSWSKNNEDKNETCVSTRASVIRQRIGVVKKSEAEVDYSREGRSLRTFISKSDLTRNKLRQRDMTKVRA